jgi:hypothetical protein
VTTLGPVLASRNLIDCVQYEFYNYRVYWYYVVTSGIVAEITALFLMISSFSSIIYCMKHKEIEI